MPRLIKRWEKRSQKYEDVVAALVEELRHPKESGQPLIREERRERTGTVDVQVIWDRWHSVPDEHRYDVILDAYEQVEGKEFRDQIHLALGLTVPEAKSLGLLPYHLFALRRSGDALTPEQYRQSMLDEGASALAEEERPLLAFLTLDEAEACKRRLEKRLPNSYWSVVYEPANVS